MCRLLLDSRGVLRVPILIALAVLIPAAVLLLASAGGWWGVAGIAIILGTCLGFMIRSG